MIVTIDGPTASGKSSVARTLAHKLMAFYVYSGLLYRGIAYVLASSYGYTHDTISSVTQDEIDACTREIMYAYTSEYGAQIYFCDNNITPYLKTSRVDALASLVSANYDVRRAVDALQRNISRQGSIVVDGRDTGTAVFPHADVKFYLTASEYIRAARWRRDQIYRGNHYSFIDSYRSLRNRDMRDFYRSVNPLTQASDAYHVDNSQLDLWKTVALLYTVIHSVQ